MPQRGPTACPIHPWIDRCDPHGRASPRSSQYPSSLRRNAPSSSRWAVSWGSKTSHSPAESCCLAKLTGTWVTPRCPRDIWRSRGQHPVDLALALGRAAPLQEREAAQILALGLMPNCSPERRAAIAATRTRGNGYATGRDQDGSHPTRHASQVMLQWCVLAHAASSRTTERTACFGLDRAWSYPAPCRRVAEILTEPHGWLPY